MFHRPATASLFVMLVLVVGCGRSSNSTWDPSAITPGEKDYPAINTDPKIPIRFKAAVPSPLRIRFEAYYSASQSAGGSPDSSDSCQRTVGLAVAAPYFLAVPLEVARDGEFEVGTIYVDRFQPGRCRWSLQGIRYLIEDGWPPYGGLAYYSNRRSDVSDYRLDVWCMKDLKYSKPGYPEECRNLSMFPDVTSRPEILSSIPVGERGDTVPVTMGSDTRSIPSYSTILTRCLAVTHRLK